MSDAKDKSHTAPNATPRVEKMTADILAERYGKPLVVALKLCVQLERELAAVVAPAPVGQPTECYACQQVNDICKCNYCPKCGSLQPQPKIRRTHHG